IYTWSFGWRNKPFFSRGNAF
ncbi:hypothetical protein AZ025_000519, partial [Escherichia coli]